MTLLEQASALLAEDGPFTLAQAKALDALCEQARGEEADMLGDLWEAAMLSARPAMSCRNAISYACALPHNIDVILRL